MDMETVGDIPSVALESQARQAQSCEAGKDCEGRVSAWAPAEAPVGACGSGAGVSGGGYCEAGLSCLGGCLPGRRGQGSEGCPGRLPAGLALAPHGCVGEGPAAEPPG